MTDNCNGLPGRPDYVIAIDPDVERSGVAFLACNSGRLEVASLTFPQLLDYLQTEAQRGARLDANVVVAVEAGWLNRAHWHVKGRDSLRAAAAKGNAAGRNHETGRLICQMARHYGLTVEEVRPLPLRVGGRPLWRGRDGKITHEEFVSLTGLLAARTNQEERDAGLIAWTYRHRG